MDCIKYCERKGRRRKLRAYEDRAEVVTRDACPPSQEWRRHTPTRSYCTCNGITSQ